MMFVVQDLTAHQAQSGVPAFKGRQREGLKGMTLHRLPTVRW